MYRNKPKEFQATAIGNMHKNLAKITHVVLEISSQTDRQTDRHTNTILRNRSHGLSKNL